MKRRVALLLVSIVALMPAGSNADEEYPCIPWRSDFASALQFVNALAPIPSEVSAILNSGLLCWDDSGLTHDCNWVFDNEIATTGGTFNGVYAPADGSFSWGVTMKPAVQTAFGGPAAPTDWGHILTRGILILSANSNQIHGAGYTFHGSRKTVYPLNDRLHLHVSAVSQVTQVQMHSYYTCRL